MTIPFTKAQIVRAIATLSEDATVEEAIECLLFLSRIEQGLEQVQRGETIPHAEVERELERLMTRWRDEG